MIDYDALIPRVQETLTRQGQGLPRWGEDDPMTRDRFAAAVQKAILGMQRELGLPDQEIPAVAKEVASRMIGLGVLEPYMRDDTVNEIIVRRGHVRLERQGRMVEVGRLAGDDYFLALARRAAEFQGRTLSAARPFVLVDLPDGSRFTAMIPPMSVEGVAINVRRFVVKRLSLDDLVALGSIDREAADFLAACVRSGRVSLLISGRPGAGKTTLLNALSAHFPAEFEVCLVEKFRELQLQHPHLAWAVVKDETQEGVSMREVVNVLYTRMRPDIIIVGEVVEDEAVEFLHAVNLGVVGMSTIHGNSALDALIRLESIVLETKATYNFLATRERIGRGINLVIHLERDGQGRRFLQEMAAVEGVENGRYRLVTLKRRAGDGFTPLSLAGAEGLQERIK